MRRCSQVRFAKGLALAGFGTPVELGPFSETMLCFLRRGDDNSTGSFLSGRCTFDLLVFQYYVENGSDGWVFNNSSHPTKEI